MVCLAEDDFTADLQTDHRCALWQARLSDGSVVTMDDGRPGAEPRSAWLRLAEHCRTTGLSVTALWLKFRSNIARFILPENADGYFFLKSSLGFLHDTETFNFYLVGVLCGDKVRVQRWQTPELVLVAEEERPAETAGESLIRTQQNIQAI